jgi:hypothetical protein
MSDETERISPRREPQAFLPFSGVQGSGAASSAAHMPDQGAGPRLDPGDPDADLEAMSDEQLLGHLEELKSQPAAVVRRLKAVVLLRQHGALAEPRWARLAAVEPSPARSRDAGWPRQVRFRSALDRVTKAGGVLGAERFAEWLAQDLYDASSIAVFRRIARGLKDGDLTRELVSEAYRRSRRPGIRHPSAFFRRYLCNRSPWLIAQGRDGQLRLR